MEQSVKPNYLEGQEITGNMRAILIDWLVQVGLKFRLLQETMYMTVGIIDRFLQVSLSVFLYRLDVLHNSIKKNVTVSNWIVCWGFSCLLPFQQDHPVPKKQLQLVGVTAMFLASKYEEMYPPEISDFAYVTDRAYTTAQIRDMEMTILRVLKFQLGRPLPLQFLRRASKIYEVWRGVGAANCSLPPLHVLRWRWDFIFLQVTAEQHTLAKYLLELSMVDYDMAHFSPSLVASAALALTLKVLDAGEWVSDTWRVCSHRWLAWDSIGYECLPSQDVTLQHYMEYTAETLTPVMAHIAKNVVKVNNGQTKHMVIFFLILL